MSALDILVRRVEEATKARSKEIRLPIGDAQGIVFELTRILSRENELLQKISDFQENGLDNLLKPVKVKAQQDNEIVMDGGNFK